ncbi:MAG TPA: hypothetical protein VE891_09745 [Allosphingosinicella sp.]|nr:hypothetical protein [Allosphingosinicella sp.]
MAKGLATGDDAAGAAVAPEGCHRNIIVSFTSDGASLARAVVEREPWRVANLSPAAKRPF